MNPCEDCGQPITKTRKGVRYCTPQCSNRAFHKRRQASGRKQTRTQHERVCVQCGKRWQTVKAKSQYYSNTCIAAGVFGPDRKPRSLPMSERVKAARRKLRKAARGTTGKGTVWTEGPCRRCGIRFLSKTSALSTATYCGRRCKQGDIGDRRRARIRCNQVETVRRSRIFERDDYRCHICGKKTNRNKTVPHPNAPTVDHLIPLALGGEHSPANVATAHFLCNATKSSTGSGDQLALVG